jgi:O-antigen/teichoic acid export membrane protein
MTRQVFSFSSSVAVTNLAWYLESKTDEIVIGAFLPVASVAPYAIARKMAEIPQLLTDQFLKVLLPIASELDAADDGVRLRALFISGTRLTLAMYTPIGVGLIMLAGEALTIWVGEGYAEYSYLIALLATSTFFATVQWPAVTILQGMGRHRPTAIAWSIAAGVNLLLSLAFVQSFGLAGVALGTLIPTTIQCLAVTMPYAAQVLRVSVREVAGSIVAPTLLPAIPMMVAIEFMRQAFAPSSYLTLGATALVGLVTYVLAYAAAGATGAERHMGRTLAAGAMRFASAQFRRG